MEETVEKIISFAIEQVKNYGHFDRHAIFDEVSHRLAFESETELNMEYFDELEDE